MRNLRVTIFMLLSVVSGMLHDEITETGTDGNVAVITCPYSTGYESYTKYFCKGGYLHCVTLIKSHGMDSFTYKGRIIMNDNTEQKKLVVTISDLRMEDAGDYGCGIELTGRDPFTLVRLKVNKAPKPPKITQPKLRQSPPPPATKNSQRNAPTLSTNKTTALNVSPTIISSAPRSVTNFLNQPSTSETALSSTEAPYLAVFIPLSVGAALLLFVGVSQVFYDRLKKNSAGNSGSVNCHHSSGPVTGSAEDGTDYENNSTGNHKSVTMSLDYKNLNPNTQQSGSVYQSQTPTPTNWIQSTRA
ncbi:CMRF35-like molecule 3 isoform X2 [Colossoma macropomum]|uniref:CMRF35-like molecule 3 isoform X2 n=1 Tax=Colossoma macropomum TaxID=42526 RepID=UPI0018654876|nr:CMRF35-like molecule 3 isoform X2 [Colossoma macropomum]